MSKVILISIKPKFVEKILNGEKTIELRKCKPYAEQGDLLLIYCTQPVKAIVGVCKINEVLDLEPHFLWEEHSINLGISETEYWDYYKNHKKAIGITLKEVSQLIDTIHLDRIRSIYPSFTPPQTFKYFPKEIFLQYFKMILRT